MLVVACTIWQIGGNKAIWKNGGKDIEVVLIMIDVGYLSVLINIFAFCARFKRFGNFCYNFGRLTLQIKKDLLACEKALAASGLINFILKSGPFFTSSCEGKHWIEVAENYFSDLVRFFSDRSWNFQCDLDINYTERSLNALLIVQILVSKLPSPTPSSFSPHASRS